MKGRSVSQCSRRSFCRTAAAAVSAGLVAAAGAAQGESEAASGAVSRARGGSAMNRGRAQADVKQSLIDYMQDLEIIDSHEHLHPERERIGRTVDVLMLLSLYAWFDTVSAGMPTDGIPSVVGGNYFLDTSVPLEKRWKHAWPFLQHIKYGSYYRPTAIALKDIYGIDDLNDRNYHEATERMRAANQPGLYRRILRDRCKIKTCLVQNGFIEGQDPPDLFTPLFANMATVQIHDTSAVEMLNRTYDIKIGDLDAYLEALGRYLGEQRSKGAIGFKINALRHVEPDMDAARTAFKKVLQDAPTEQVLKSTVLDYILKRAKEWDWLIAVHCGIWGDYRTFDPKNVIDLVMKYPKVRFDLYHLGMPYARDCIFIAKIFPNAFLNLCWCYAISQEITRRTINEILDTVPVNKVFGFGADYSWEVENVYGHLVMARETIAEALSERISRGQLDVEGAKHISKLWLHDNPVRFYGLK